MVCAPDNFLQRWPFGHQQSGTCTYVHGKAAKNKRREIAQCFVGLWCPCLYFINLTAFIKTGLAKRPLFLNLRHMLHDNVVCVKKENESAEHPFSYFKVVSLLDACGKLPFRVLL
uniref:Uncharacterized protein n=1 Tax=Trypanosoma congolense (strain IL3000) TaxID=1068625 RepID=G0ULW0_TRYCI|nr:hypothetical protein, unlikely [Trypanosoma congolense IL3000]